MLLSNNIVEIYYSLDPRFNQFFSTSADEAEEKHQKNPIFSPTK